MTKGRKPGSEKDPDRPRIRNLNGRLIDVGGPQYWNLICDGYTIETNSIVLHCGTKIEFKKFIGKNKIHPAAKIKNYNGSMIQVNGAAYKEVLKMDIN
mgnify:FL=1